MFTARPGAEGRATRAAPLLFLAAALLLRAPAFPAAVLDPDEGLYLLQARAWLDGGWPWIAVWDMHPPGAPALLALALVLVPDPVMAARLAGVVAVAATATGLHAIALRLGGGRATGLAAGLMYVAQTTMPGGLATNTEILFAPFVVLAALLLLGEARREAPPRAGIVLAAGLAAGIALWVKQVAALEASALWVTMVVVAWRAGWLRARRVPVLAALFALGAGLPTLGLAAGYWAAGHGATWWQANVAAPLQYAGVAVDAPGLRAGVLGAAPWLAGLLVAGAGCGFRDVAARRAARLLWPWLAASVLAVAAPGKFFDHYFLILLPPLALLAAFGIAATLRHAVMPAYRARGFVVIAALVMAVPVAGMLVPRLASGIGLRGADPVREVARAAEAALRPGEALFVANWHTLTYVLADVPAPTRFAFPLHLSGQAQHLAGVDTAAELERVLALPPGVIVVDPGRWGLIRAEARAAIEAALARDYERAATIRDGPGPVEVWRRR